MSGITQYKPDKAFEGYTLFSETFSEPNWEVGKEAVVYLIDMNGEPAHTWHLTQHTVQSHCRLLPNGHLLVPTHDRSGVTQCNNVGIFEYDPDSTLVWRVRCRTDHDYQVRDNGNLLIHTLNETMCPPLGPELKRHPYMIEITRDKELAWEWKGEEHLKDLEACLSPEAWQHVLDRATRRFAFDWAHNNTLQIIQPNKNGDDARFKPGNIFFSYRSNDVIGVIDYDTGDIVWAWGPGIIDGQHKPHMLANGNVLIFDNGTLRGYSRVIELNGDPASSTGSTNPTCSPTEMY